ncbi:MAG TPA: phage holin family protein [Terriglobales bacterium]|nr:phage holin family protein [Terriglobales bacterium]
MANGVVREEKSLGSVVSELKFELREFIQTRLQILREELKGKAAVLKIAVPMFAIALALFWVGFLLLTGLFVVLIASAFGGVAGFAWAFLIVGFVYFIVGGICAMFAWSEVKSKSLAPKRTIQVLKQDQIWLRNEARTQV